MKLIILASVLYLAVLTSGAYVPSSQTDKLVKYADKDFLVKQKFVFEVLRNIYEPLQFDEYKGYTKDWITDETKYTDFKQVDDFFRYFKVGYLEKGEIFTIMNEVHKEQTYMLFNFFYNCKDWDTFYKNVCWARENCNDGMFIYAFTLAVLHRTDCVGIVLPAIYEIYPHYFFKTDVMYEAMHRKLVDPKFGFYDNEKMNYVYTNKTHMTTYGTHDYYYNHRALSYFTEDIGLNAYYYYFMMDYPFFLGKDKFNFYKDRRGELYLYMHQQLLARYYMERKANYMGPVEKFSWEKPIKKGYHSLLSYHNGLPFTPRTDNYVIPEYNFDKLDILKDYELRIRNMIDYGFVTVDDNKKIDLRTPEAIDYLGNLINANPDSSNTRFYRYVEIFARLLLSGNDGYHTKYHMLPGVMMHFETTMRDPMFYQLYSRIINYYYQFKHHLPNYTFDELTFKGVEIKSVVVDKLMTYFEYFDADISNAIPVTDKKLTDEKVGTIWDHNVFARQKRINHKPFSFTIDVTAETTAKGVLRVYYGPKFVNAYEIDEYRKYFVEVDQFVVDLVAGKNTIARNSREFYYNVRDRTTYTELYKKVMSAYNGKEKFPLDMSEAHCGWPDRLLLPKGHGSGYEMQFYFIITPYYAPKVEQFSTYDHTISCGVGSGSRYLDNLPFGYPFDREINYSYFYKVQNMYFKDVMVYHMDEMTMNKAY